MTDLLPAIEMEAFDEGEANASVIWLHGLGADGNDFAPIVPQLKLSPEARVRFIFPHAPSIPVTINNGYVMPAWYDILQIGGSGRSFDEAQFMTSAGIVQGFIEQEIARGVPSSRIVVAGFSQGGAISYEAALSFDKPLAGLMALSTYFATAETVAVNTVNSDLPILICHGSQDPVVNESLGRSSEENLRGRGFKPEYKSYPMEHSVCLSEIDDISDWLRRVIP